MKKYRGVLYVLCVIVYAVFGLIITNYATDIMAEKEFSLIAANARILALVAAGSYRITDSEVAELKQLEFAAVIRHPANIRLENMFKHNHHGENEIRFAYIMVELKEDQIKYHVTDEYAQFFGAEAGTPLNLQWLVDVVVGKTVEETLADDETYYDDIKRYSYFRANDEKAYREGTATYLLSDDEYGRVISGLAPVYSAEGTFVGMLGVDIHIERYERETEQIRNILSAVFILPTIVLTAAYVFLYIKNRKYTYSAAYTDPLTAVYNRRFIEKYLPVIVREHYKKKQPLTVIMIDVDFFKPYNDHYGHQRGDEALIKVSGVINSALRQKTDFVCRYGGEEILVILANTGLSVAGMIAGRIKASVDALAIKHEYSEVSDIVTISQGVYASVPESLDSDKEFILHADKGLYEAKSSGRNRFVIVGK